ncbi:Hpt domain-containing protein [Puia dinghuensis]|nr:Hpt domain-containing protein [Puia dinghuensis]
MSFIFSDEINGSYVIELYAGDYVMIEETFEDVLREYDVFVERIITTYHEGDAGALKSAVHKIKPLFGFVGLTTLQAQCLQFENSCQTKSCPELANAFVSLKKELLEAKSVIAKEKERLAAFNRLPG